MSTGVNGNGDSNHVLSGLLNRYRLKRKIGRGVNRLNYVLGKRPSPGQIYHDYDWHDRKRNPFQNPSVAGARTKIMILLCFGLLLVTLSLLFYHPFFSIKKIEIVGTQRLETGDLQQTVEGIINYQRFFILPGRNYFLINLNDIRDVLKNKYALESIIVHKKFPDTIEILIQEKISTVIFVSPQYWYYLDTNGRVLEILSQFELPTIPATPTTTTEVSSTEKIVLPEPTINPEIIMREFGDYPIVAKPSFPIKTEVQKGDDILTTEEIGEVIKYYKLFNTNPKMSFAYLELTTVPQEGIIHTWGGKKVLIRLNRQPEDIFQEFNYILQNKIKNNSFTYLDLRFAGRIYWQ